MTACSTHFFFRNFDCRLCIAIGAWKVSHIGYLCVPHAMIHVTQQWELYNNEPFEWMSAARGIEMCFPDFHILNDAENQCEAKVSAKECGDLVDHPGLPTPCSLADEEPGSNEKKPEAVDDSCIQKYEEYRSPIAAAKRSLAKARNRHKRKGSPCLCDSCGYVSCNKLLMQRHCRSYHGCIGSEK